VSQVHQTHNALLDPLEGKEVTGGPGRTVRAAAVPRVEDEDGAAVSSRRRGSSAEIVRSFSFCVYF